MRLLSIWIIFWAALSCRAQNSSSQAATQQLVASLPRCALLCLVSSLANSTCLPTNQTCICTNEPLKAKISTCVQASCTIKEALVTLNVTSVACGDPIRDKRLLYNLISNIFGVTSGVAVVLRLYARYISDSNFWLDDYAVVFTLLIGIPSSIINVQGLTRNGLGRDIWKLSFRNISDMLHVFYYSEILYFFQVSAVKITILLFYLRVFPGTGIRKICWATIVLNVMIGIIFGFLAIFQCRPISYTWKQWDGQHSGVCLNNNALGWSNAALSIALDLFMLSLPMTQIVHLHLHWKKKLGVAMMFGVGAFVTIVSILRLRSLVVFSKSQNPTWDNLEVGYWSTIEINVGIICACMPSLRLLLMRAFPNVMGTSYSRSGNNASSKNSSRGVGSRVQGNSFNDRSGHNQQHDDRDSLYELTKVDRVTNTVNPV